MPAEVISKIVDDLPNLLTNNVDEQKRWEPEIIIDPLVGSAEYMNKLLNKANHLKNKNNWDYVICLTDLPQFMEKHVIMADINREQQITLLSIPSFGFFPLKRRMKQTILQVIKEMYTNNEPSSLPRKRKVHRDRLKSSEKGPFKSLFRIDMRYEKEKPHDEDNNTLAAKIELEKNEETQESTDKRTDIRYIIRSKLLGQFRILAGMIFANRPWRALFSFKKVLMMGFATGIYITIFPTPWELSTIYSIPRFFLLMFTSMIAMVIWITFSHHLWEKPSKKGDIRIRRLYNVTTLSTLSVIVLINYIVLFFLFLATLYIFVPSGLFEASTDISGDATFIYYVRLTWLATSLGTLAGSIGTAAENEDTIRQITYSYRQINRYYDIQEESEKSYNENRHRSEY